MEQEHRKWSKERWKVFFEKDLPIWITIACFVVFCVVMCIDDDKPATKTGATQPNNHNERQVEEVSASTTTRRRIFSVQSQENEMIDRLSREDFYEESDYYDGLDGEYNDIFPPCQPEGLKRGGDSPFRKTNYLPHEYTKV